MNEKAPLAISFLQKQPLGILATVNENNSPETAAVFCVIDDRLDIYFLSSGGTRKLNNMESHSEVSITFVNEEHWQTLQVQGHAEILATPVEAIYFDSVPEDVTERLLALHTRQTTVTATPAFIAGQGAQQIVKITPTWMRLADFRESAKELYTMVVG